jgi:hypothetical protein
VLVGAIYEGDDVPVFLTLVFDRAVSTAGMVGTQITVRDGGLNERSCTTRRAGDAARCVTVRSSSSSGPGSVTTSKLTATRATGIVAVGDGGTWAGVTNLVLPWP